MTTHVMAVCCAAPDRPGAGHFTNLLGHHPDPVHCRQCGKQYSIDYDPSDLSRIVPFEEKLLVAAQNAVNDNHPWHGNYVNVGEI
jgi:hypothetical protein